MDIFDVVNNFFHRLDQKYLNSEKSTHREKIALLFFLEFL